jgi:hypothetical protein
MEPRKPSPTPACSAACSPCARACCRPPPCGARCRSQRATATSAAAPGATDAARTGVSQGKRATALVGRQSTEGGWPRAWSSAGRPREALAFHQAQVSMAAAAARSAPTRPPLPLFRPTCPGWRGPPNSQPAAAAAPPPSAPCGQPRAHNRAAPGAAPPRSWPCRLSPTAAMERIRLQPRRPPPLPSLPSLLALPLLPQVVGRWQGLQAASAAAGARRAG